jgi:hypothetical protein
VTYAHTVADCPEHHDLVRDFGGPRPTITVLCGSTRFKDAWYEQGKRLTYEGKIVLSVGDLDTSSAARNINVLIDEDLKTALDDLHKRKIDLADQVYVLNVGGYVGESTRSEIEYAERLGKPVAYLEPVAGTEQPLTSTEEMELYITKGIVPSGYAIRRALDDDRSEVLAMLDRRAPAHPEGTPDAGS